MAQRAHLNWLHNRVETGEVAQFVIYDGETAVGSVYLRDIDRSNQKCEYGIFIGDEDCRGKGIGTAAAKLALAYAFEQLQMNRVYLRVFADNLGAMTAWARTSYSWQFCAKIGKKVSNSWKKFPL